MRQLPIIRILLVVVPLVGLLGWWLGRDTHEAFPPPAQKPEVASQSPKSSKPDAGVTSPVEAKHAEFVIPAPLSDAQVLEQSKLIAALGASQDENECRQLAADLAALNSEEAVAALWQLAQTKASRALRTAVLDGLDSVTNPKAVTASVTILKTITEPEMRTAANRLIGRGANRDSVNALAQLYVDEDSSVMQQKQVEQAVAGIRSENAINALGLLIENAANPTLASAAALSLAQIGTPGALGQLQSAQGRLKSQGPGTTAVQEAVQRALDGAAKAQAQTSKGSPAP